MFVRCDTRERAEWLIELLRPHAAFREGVLEVEVAEPSDGVSGPYRVVYHGPRVHEGYRVQMEPLNPDGEFYADRADADRECARVSREIPPDEVSAVHVEANGDGGPWYLLWIAAAIQHPGDTRPKLPERPDY
jgi:hypothetical protein